MSTEEALSSNENSDDLGNRFLLAGDKKVYGKFDYRLKLCPELAKAWQHVQDTKSEDDAANFFKQVAATPPKVAKPK